MEWKTLNLLFVLIVLQFNTTNAATPMANSDPTFFHIPLEAAFELHVDCLKAKILPVI